MNAASTPIDFYLGIIESTIVKSTALKHAYTARVETPGAYRRGSSIDLFRQTVRIQSIPDTIQLPLVLLLT